MAEYAQKKVIIGLANNNMHYTKHADQKFDILNDYRVFFRREQVDDCMKYPDKVGKKGKYLFVVKDNLKVIYKKEGGVARIITFFPVK